MSVSNGQQADQNTFNNAFMSRTSNTSTTGKVDLQNTNDASAENDTGASVHTAGGLAVEKKAFINELRVSTFKNIAKTFSVESIISNGVISLTLNQSIQMRRVQGNGAPITANNNPFGSMSGADDGLLIILIGSDDTNTVKIPESDTQYGCYINGSATLKRGFVLGLIYDSVAERFYELFRSF